MKCHHAYFGENVDLPLWRGPAVKKKPPFLVQSALLEWLHTMCHTYVICFANLMLSLWCYSVKNKSKLLQTHAQIG